ncbi:cytochrome ubiquinol oxidase subunit I [Legionella sp.]
MLFGWKRVPPGLHFTATLLVTLGTTVSAFWILAANSWMQTPHGYEVINGKYVVADWWRVVFNPSFIPRFLHMILASYTTTCFVVGGVACYFLLKNRHQDIAKKSLSFAMWAALVVVPLQIFIGDTVGLAVHRYQPLKTAAMEANWTTQKGASLILFAWPSQEQQKNEFVIAIPKLASLLNTHEWDGELLGLNAVDKTEQPHVAPVFFAFRVMVGIGLLMLITALVALLLRMKSTLYTSRFFHQWCLFIAPLGFIASISGWLTAEIGRQPWVVYNLLKIKEAISAVGMEEVIISFVLLVLAYGVVFSFYLYYLFKMIRLGPLALDSHDIEHHSFQYMTDQGEH